MRAWRTLIAGIIVAGLAVALAVVLATGVPGDGAPIPTLAEASGTPRTTTTTPTDPPNAPDTTAATTTTTTTTTTTASAAIVAMRDALAAWGEFAVTGRIRDLGDHFVVGGPQRRQLRAEGEAIRADPLGAPPYVVTAGDVLTISTSPTGVVLRTEIGWARDGEPTQSFIWDIQMLLVDGSWRLLTVVEVEDG